MCAEQAAEGVYFSEEAMKERAPLLYHEHIAQYESVRAPPEAHSAAGNMSAYILQMHDQARFRQRVKEAKERQV